MSVVAQALTIVPEAWCIDADIPIGVDPSLDIGGLGEGRVDGERDPCAEIVKGGRLARTSDPYVAEHFAILILKANCPGAYFYEDVFDDILGLQSGEK